MSIYAGVYSVFSSGKFFEFSALCSSVIGTLPDKKIMAAKIGPQPDWIVHLAS